MKRVHWLFRWIWAVGLVSLLALPSLAWSQSAASPSAMTLTFQGVGYEHRWSQNGQNEFTPKGQTDLRAWKDMVTLNVHEAVTTGDDLAAVANRVLGGYQQAGQIVRTMSTPRTPQRPAEHLVVAVLGNADLLEAVFARFVLVDGAGVTVVYSHRLYGANMGKAMSEWLGANGPQIEQALMTWERLPSPSALKRLPQSR